MKFVTYVLQSEKSGRLYIGHSANFEERFRRHQTNRNPATRGRGPWKALYRKTFATRSEAIHRERWLKARKNRTRILDYIETQPEGQ